MYETSTQIKMIQRKQICVYALVVASLLLNGCATSEKKTDRKPNVIIIFTDDQGYQDVGCYGSPKIKTPNLDQMAEEGVRLTDFYVANSICSPSRASLLTGRLPLRTGFTGVIFPREKGLSTSEVTIAEVLKGAGYQTACFGKWHLGDLKGEMPMDQGFDTYYGIPYSNDMYIGKGQKFASKVTFRQGYNLEKAQQDQDTTHKYHKVWSVLEPRGLKMKCPLFEGDEIVEYPCDQATLTQRYFDRAIDYISSVKDDPFFVYLTPAMPHIPLYASDRFKGTSERGLYGDVIEEIDFYTGKLLKHLKAEGLDENTLVIFSSDNGPWIKYGEQGGSALPLRDGKMNCYEGGYRVPCIVRWPGKIKPAVSSEIVSATDLLPTIAHYAGAQLPNVKLDGMNIANHLENIQTPSGRTEITYTKRNTLMGIRSGDWKYLPHGGLKPNQGEPELYNLKDDLAESKNIYDQYPEKVEEMKRLWEERDKSLREN